MGARREADWVVAHPKAPAKLGERVGQKPGMPTTKAYSVWLASRCRVGRAPFIQP